MYLVNVHVHVLVHFHALVHIHVHVHVYVYVHAHRHGHFGIVPESVPTKTECLNFFQKLLNAQQNKAVR